MKVVGFFCSELLNETAVMFLKVVVDYVRSASLGYIRGFCRSACCVGIVGASVFRSTLKRTRIEGFSRMRD